MDARGRDESHAHRASSKRPWDGDNSGLPGRTGPRIMAQALPPINATSSLKLSVPRGSDYGSNSRSWYIADSNEAEVERTKTEGLENINPFVRQNLDTNGIHPSPRPHVSDFMPGQLHRSSKSPQASPDNANRPPRAQQSQDLCYRCRGPRFQDQEFDPAIASCESCKRNPELAWVTQAAAAGLTQLAETLRSGMPSEQRNIPRGGDVPTLAPSDFPPIAQSGLKQTLDWILGSISHANQLADNFVRRASSLTLSDHTTLPGLPDGPANIMKRRHHEDVEDAAGKIRGDASDMGPGSDFNSHGRVDSSTIGSVSDELSRVTTQHGHHAPLHSPDSRARRLSGMNPPPAPHRHLPSPPGRSFPSPTSLSFPSPAGPSPNSSQGVSTPTPLSVSHTIDNYLPPLTAPRASDSALREHAAALQHEVSLQKMALSSLQGEHDKLLAAFSRSQTRATTLEKKHAVSDNEIINLTEEKLRLQAQVLDLERDVEELTRSRDESRQSAVQEGAQYIEIVNKASRLEERRADEQRAWSRVKEEMERKIAALSAGSNEDISAQETAPTSIQPAGSEADEMDMAPDSLKIERMEPLPLDDEAPHASESPLEIIEALKMEIHLLRERCSQAEKALQDIRDDSRSMEELAKAIHSRVDSGIGN